MYVVHWAKSVFGLNTYILAVCRVHVHNIVVAHGVSSKTKVAGSISSVNDSDISVVIDTHVAHANGIYEHHKAHATVLKLNVPVILHQSNQYST